VGDNTKNSWLSSPASVIVILSVLLNAMGFLTVRTFIVRLCLPTNYFENTPIDYLQWGIKAIVTLVFSFIYVTLAVAIAAIIIAILFFLFRLTFFRIKSVRELLDTLVLNPLSLVGRISVSRLTGLLFIMSFVVFIIYVSIQSPVINEFWGLQDCQSVPTVFSDANQPQLNNFQFSSAALILILSLTLLCSIRIQKRANGRKVFPIIFTCGIFSLWLFALAFWAMPYRLISHNEFEAVKYNDSTAYIISEKDSQLFLYVPGERPFIIGKNDTLLNRTGKIYYENIFNYQKEAK
jgi:hypothetical protein